MNTADGKPLDLKMTVYTVSYDYGGHEPEIKTYNLWKFPEGELVIKDDCIFRVNGTLKWLEFLWIGNLFADYKNAQKQVVKDLEEHVEEVFERIAEIQKEIGET